MEYVSKKSRWILALLPGLCLDASLNVGGPGGTAGDGRLRGVSQAREAPVDERDRRSSTLVEKSNRAEGAQLLSASLAIEHRRPPKSSRAREDTSLATLDNNPEDPTSK